MKKNVMAAKQAATAAAACSWTQQGLRGAARWGARGLALVAFMTACGSGQSAHALPSCQPCMYYGNIGNYFGYVIPPDGVEYEWDFRNYVGATLSVSPPNDNYSEDYYSDGNGGVGTVIFNNASYRFREDNSPGLTRIFMQSPAIFNNCRTTFTPGVHCGGVYTFWSDSAPLGASLRENFEFFTSVTAGVPEPATWVMMLAGMFGLGAALRFRRHAQSRKDPEHLGAQASW